MLAVRDVNVTLPEHVMTSGTEGSKAASEVILSRIDRPASARHPLWMTRAGGPASERGAKTAGGVSPLTEAETDRIWSLR